MQKIYTKRESARVDNPPRLAKLVHQKTHIVYEVDVLLILTFLQYDLTPSLASAISPSPFASYGQRPFWPWRIAHSVKNVQKKRQHERLLRFQYQHDCTRQRYMAREVATRAQHVHPTGHVLKPTAYD